MLLLCGALLVFHFVIALEALSVRKDNSEIVYLPFLLPSEEDSSQEDLSLVFEAFGLPIDLKLKRNNQLISPHFKAYVHDGGASPRLLNVTKSEQTCLYYHHNGHNIGAFSACATAPAMQGFLIFNNKTLEILPLDKEHPLDNGRSAHIVREVSVEAAQVDAMIKEALADRQSSMHRIAKRARHKPVGGYTLELALFFDAAAYGIFSPFMQRDDHQLHLMILAYLNGVQALYHHPSLGTTLEIVLVRLDIMKQQPRDLPHFDGERSRLLDSFCSYQHSLNARSDADPSHWDMGVYISGLDFFAYENGRKSGVTMGLATVGGVCLGQYACVIAELGTTNVFGKPYPSAGFTSVYILAHEIGHNLGMHHDSIGNSCAKDGFIMSPSRGTNGETQWSRCSAEVMADLEWAKCLVDGAATKPDLDHKKFFDTPGQVYTAKKQCEVLLTDRDAVVAPNQHLSTICYNLQCKTPHRSGYYHSGPALDGTECGVGRYCFGGECVAKQPPKPIEAFPGGWGAWKLGACTSGCTFKSLGYQERHRSCDNPTPLNTDAGCEGNSFQIGLCKDDKLCSKQKRRSSTEFASLKCRDFAKVLPQLDSRGAGLQAPHETGRLWMGCAIFCRREGSQSFYTPRIELNDLGISPYFPDGTWCHSDATDNYYCQQHHCLSEHFQFTKTFLNHLDWDIPIPQNAHPNNSLPMSVQLYLSLDQEGKPLKTEIAHGVHNMSEVDDWETNDYVELPPHAKQQYLNNYRLV